MTSAVTDNERTPDDSNDHYLETVTDLGEVEEIVAAEDIYSQSNVLLIKKGAKVNKKTYDALSKHKLKSSIDNIVSVTDAVTNHELALDFYTQLENFDLFVQLQPSILNPERLKNCLRQVDLNAAMRTKITVAKKVNPALYEHLLRVSICTVMTGMAMGLDDKGCDILASAGLFHDLGQLHIDPELLATNRMLNTAELKFVYAHPVIMYQQLIAMDAYPKETAIAILEHHERVGGNGYPKGAKEYSNIYASILAVTEVLISMAESQPLDRAIIALKSNASRFDSLVMNALFKMLVSREKPQAEFNKTKQDLCAVEEILKDRMVHWRSVAAEIENQSDIGQITTIKARMHDFQQSTTRWGFDLENQNLFEGCDDDPEAVNDLIMLLEESLYILRDICREFHRNIPENHNHRNSSELTEWIKCTMESVDAYSSNLLIDETL